MQHESSLDGGLGFCHAAIPSVLPTGWHGPMIVALDSNIVIDLMQHGEALIDGRRPQRGGADPKYSAELEALGEILDIWLLRDIRLHVTSRFLSDSRGLTRDEVVPERRRTAARFADSLRYQTRWEREIGDTDKSVGELTAVHVSLPEGADRDLVAEAVIAGAHVFLTRDSQILQLAKVGSTAILSPSMLDAVLAEAGVGHLGGGVCGLPDCVYARSGWPILAPDMGKWTGLLSVISATSD